MFKTKRGLFNFKFLKLLDQKGLGTLPRIFLSSVFVLFFFFSMPKVINHINNKSEEFQNNSSLLRGKKILIKGYGSVGSRLANFCKESGAIVEIVDFESKKW